MMVAFKQIENYQKNEIIVCNSTHVFGEIQIFQHESQENIANLVDLCRVENPASDQFLIF